MSELRDLIDAAQAGAPLAGMVRAVLRAAQEAADPTPASTWLATLNAALLPEDVRCAAARALLAWGAKDEALRWAQGQQAETCAVRARILLALGRPDDARVAFDAARAADPGLRDEALDAAFALAAAHGGGDQGAGVVVDLRGRPVGPDAAPDPSAPQRPALTFADVGGLDSVKNEIRRKIILPFQKPALFEKFKKRAGGGVLLYGPPGCGKTMIARATAGEVGAQFWPVEITDILDMYIGESEKRLASAFDQARARTPTVLFFDEIEALAARRRFGENDNRASLVSTFLNELDGVGAANDGVLVLAATNVPWAIDMAFRRQGRFDRVVFVPPPDRDARAAILALALANRPVADAVSLEPLVQATPGYSGADLSAIVELACDLAIEESLSSDRIAPITQKLLTTALREVKPTTVEWLSQARNYAKYANEGGLYDDVIAFLDKNTR
jgi:transitional endoplasmic reticulum ATPase